MFGTRPAFLADYRSLALDMRYISIFFLKFKSYPDFLADQKTKGFILYYNLFGAKR